jgi:hypothetical protein
MERSIRPLLANVADQQPRIRYYIYRSAAYIRTYVRWVVQVGRIYIGQYVLVVWPIRCMLDQDLCCRLEERDTCVILRGSVT